MFDLENPVHSNKLIEFRNHPALHSWQWTESTEWGLRHRGRHGQRARMDGHTDRHTETQTNQTLVLHRTEYVSHCPDSNPQTDTHAYKWHHVHGMSTRMGLFQLSTSLNNGGNVWFHWSTNFRSTTTTILISYSSVSLFLYPYCIPDVVKVALGTGLVGH